MDKLHENGISVILSTPSGARPDWMDKKYPEVLRVSPGRVRNLRGCRHNHCYTSPFVREAGISPVVSWEIPQGVSVTKRQGNGEEYIFVMNFSEDNKKLALDKRYTDLISGNKLAGETQFEPYGVRILRVN